MARRGHKRSNNGGALPAVQAQPLPPGGNRFQPSASYLAQTRSQPQLNLTPATAPASWPPAPAAPLGYQPLATARPTAAARWVEQQEVERNAADAGAGPSKPPGHSAARWVDSDDEPEPLAVSADVSPPPAPQPPSPPSTLVSVLLADLDDEALYGDAAEETFDSVVASHDPPPRPPSPTHSIDSSILYGDENDPLPQPSPSIPHHDPSHADEPAAATDYIALFDSDDAGEESDESDEDFIQEQLVGKSSARDQDAQDSDEELYGTGGDTEVIVLNDSDLDLDQHEQELARDSSPEDHFDLVIDSSDEDADALEVLESDSIEVQGTEKRPREDGAPDSSPKRRRISWDEPATDADFEDGEVHEPPPPSASRWLSPDAVPDSATTQAGGLASARRPAAGGLSHAFSSTSQEQETPLVNAGLPASAPRAGLLSRAFAASHSADSAADLSSSVETPASAFEYRRPSQADSTISLDPAAAPTTASGAVPSIQPIVIPQARDRATYQRRVDLSSTPYGTPIVGDTGIRDDRGKITYKPSPIVAAPLHQAPSTSVTAKATYSRPSNADLVAPNDAVKAAYSRRASNSTKLAQPRQTGHLPLSIVERSLNLPIKLAAAFPSEFSPDFPANAPHLFAPANLATAAAKALPPPHKHAHFGFWPAPPPLVSGKGVFPPPRPQPGVVAAENDKRPPVHIFVDNSNVLYAFLDWVRARPEAKLMSFTTTRDGRAKTTKTVTLAGRKVKMDYPTLFALLERGRRVEKRILVASSALWQSLEPAVEWGYEISLLQRVHRPAPEPTEGKRRTSGVGSNGKSVVAPGRGGKAFVQQRKGGPHAAEEKQANIYKEQAVDELIHMKLLESLLDCAPPADALPPTLVLVSGDAKTSEYNPTGFLGCVRRALERGWDVEIVSFAAGTSAAWLAEEKKAREEGRGSLRVVDLELFAEELVM